jgi:hypothetical protein
VWRSLYAAAQAMTPFKRGVSDLGCGRGHDRRCGQISWSLTPRSYSLALSLPWRSLAVGGERRPCSSTRRSPNAHSFEWSNRRFDRPARIDQTGPLRVAQRGNTPRRALFPFLFPLCGQNG